MVLRRSSRLRGAERSSDSAAVRGAADALLARRDFSRGELFARLCAGGFERAAVDAVLLELESAGIVDDRRFAQNYVTWHAARGQGPLRIGADLRRQGLAAELVEAALGADVDWHALAGRVRRAKFGAQPPVSWPDKARQARFLQYRGFSADHIRAATGADPDLD